MHKLFMTAVLITLLFATPVAAESLFPDFEEMNQEASIMYGGSDGEQYWYSFSTILEDTDTGQILDFLTIPGTTPSRAYGWYRYTDNFDTDPDTQEYQDFIIGTEFGLAESSIFDEMFIYSFTERIRIVSGPHGSDIDIGIAGMGARWSPAKEFSASVAAGYDMNETFLIKLTAHSNPYEELEIDGYVWSVLDDDSWGYWQLQFTHPLTENINARIVYEHTTRSPAVWLAGITYLL